MKEQVKISVIVPAYNAELWLKRCVDSICSQTYKDLEIILINDGSTDDTGHIIEHYKLCDSRVKTVHQDNRGLVLTREKGISIATGEYVTFVDADDVVTSDMYERLLNNALIYNADISHCGMCFSYQDGRKELHYGSGKVIVQDNFEGLRDLLSGEFIEPSLCNKLYRASLLTDSCLDSSIQNNEDLLRNFILFSRSKKSVYEDFCGYQYIQYEESMSKSVSKQINISQQVIRARQLIVEHSSEQILPYAKRTWMSAIVNTINQMMFATDDAKQKYFEECRALLKREKKNIPYLIKRQRLAANLILKAPCLYRMVYKVYLRKYEV